ncbi:MAG: hypothetical protein LBP40_07680 [Campylobacteraceae bacterium]|nr:hypothetical protein [Campylobacteraceae bacterium]
MDTSISHNGFFAKGHSSHGYDKIGRLMYAVNNFIQSDICISNNNPKHKI